MHARTPAARTSSAGRSRNAQRPGSRGRTSRPAPRPAVVVSDLEQGLDAAAALPAPDAPSFAALGLPQHVVTALERRDIRAPFAIQTRAIPDALAGRDVLGRASTGSGKTLAFGLPMLARLQGGTRVPGRPRGLVLLPTRELAQQVHDALAPIGQSLGLTMCTVYGGASMGRQISQLRRGVDLVIATPGRLEDLINQRECNLGAIEIAVLDEADHMADLGFLPAVTRLLDQTPTGGQRLLFSATLDRGVDKVVRAYLTNPALHAVADDNSAVAAMSHLVFSVQSDAKVEVASRIAARPGRTLFFVRTKHGADRLALQMRRTGVEAGSIHGNLTQNARTRALDAFKRGSVRVLVATDVAARGIHVDDIDLVVHYDPPADHKDYLHRSGRTARAGATGTVLSLVLSEQVREHQAMRERAGVQANAVAVTADHPAVHGLATSGEPIEVQPAPAAPAQRPAGSSSYAGRNRPPHRNPRARRTA